MDFTLRCNSLKCRTQLTDRAVVTTCSHVFCSPCSDSLGLTAPAGANRVCPACQTSLTQPDDAVSTSLQPTEDYKTSVLSGLNPSTIMECAGRGLAFWSYQSTQEIIYQEYLAKTLTEKYNTLNIHLDKVVNNATSEMNILNQQLSNMQIDQDRLKAENTSLVAAFREKHRKYQQTQELYDRLKRKEMTAATQSAAFDSVEEVLGNVSSRQGLGIPSRNTQYPAGPAMSAQRGPQPTNYDSNGGEHLPTHQRTGSNHSQGSGGMPPPPLRRLGGLDRPLGYSNLLPTPSNHRTQLGPVTQSSSRLNTGNHRRGAGVANRNPQDTQRQVFGSISGNSMERPGMSGYGMSAGMKVGRQNGSRMDAEFYPNQGSLGDHPSQGSSQGQQYRPDGGSYF